MSRANQEETLQRPDVIQLLDISDPNELQALFKTAYKIKKQNVGKVVYFRGLIEISNLCQKDCLYCGIRKSNHDVNRFRLSVQEIVDAAVWAHKNQYGSLVLQGGEIQGDEHADYITRVLERIHQATRNELAITLSLGEQSREVLGRWRLAGAHRYLLRLETSREDLYRQFHPDDHLWQNRLDCLADLRAENYQVGTGVMIGLPGQSTSDLADDLLYIRDLDVDMIGMGPFIPHSDTPMAHHLPNFNKNKQLDLGLKMLACARLLLPNANMAATTALQALSDTGRELGLQAGGNIVMPNVTDPKHRRAYQLYDGKPSLDENSEQSRIGLQRRIESIGETVGYGLWGNSPRFDQRGV
ncbi:MAG: [FeFe] hydrogenase H-cluster radical SAM maturase HydE [bacterium]|nr:[FeFe] hydrogenase H-cluster radical SAM maturase HydE [bacterium]